VGTLKRRGTRVGGTGLPRSTCVRFLDDLREAGTAEVQVRARRMGVRPRELVGAERDAMWNDVLEPIEDT
jgi:DNA-binding IclR family transcriptional regulator